MQTFSSVKSLLKVNNFATIKHYQALFADYVQMLLNVKLLQYKPGIDSWKRLWLTPKLFDWLADVSQQQGGSFSMAIMMQLIWKIFWADTSRSSTMWAPQKKGRKAFPLTKSCIRHCTDCLFVVFEVI